MEVQPAAAPAAPAAPAPNSSEHTPAAAASQNAPITVSTGAPGTSSANKPTEATGKWTDAFDSDMKDFVNQRGFQDPKAVLESYRNLEKLRGVPQDRLLKLPEATAGADAPEWNDIYSKLGKPATPEGYGFQAKDPNNSGFTNWAKEAFHKLNLTTAQGQELVKQFNAYNEQLTANDGAAYSDQVKGQVDTMKKEWGAAFNQNVARAQAAYRQLGVPDKAIDALEREIGFDGVMRMFHGFGSKIGEHSFVGSDGGSQGFGEGHIFTPEQANARIKALKQDGEWAARYIKGDVKARQEMDRLMKMANPTD
jgi:hypothetical protein